MKARLAIGLAAATFAAAAAAGQPPADPTRDYPPHDASSGPPGAVPLVVEAGPGSLAARWARAVRADLALVSEVRLVRRADVVLRADEIRDAGPPRLQVTLTREGTRAELEVPDPTAAAAAGHASADAALEALTGRRGAFDSTLVFARPAGRGRKDILRVRTDGRGLIRASTGRGVALLPTIAHGAIWYSVLLDGGLYLTRAGDDDRVVVGGPGLTMGVTPCEAGIAFSSSRDGDAEIYRADAEGGSLARITFHPGIDVSPTCSGRGEVAFVSNRSGRPQIHLLGNGDLHPDRIPQPDAENQTPTWCPSPDRRVLAFTRLGSDTGVWTVDLDTGAQTRITPRGRFKDPAFSPDCRLIAYGGAQGLWLSSADGRRRRRILAGTADTIAWGRL